MSDRLQPNSSDSTCREAVNCDDAMTRPVVLSARVAQNAELPGCRGGQLVPCIRFPCWCHPGESGSSVSLASLALVCPGNGALAAPALPVIGFATSDKQVRVNGRLEHGNVTLFEGDAIYSEDSVCRIHIKNGTSLSLANKSRVRLSAETVDLDEGSARIFGYPLHSHTTRARGLLVRADRSRVGYRFRVWPDH